MSAAATMEGSLNVHFNRFYTQFMGGPTCASLKAHPTRLKIIEKLECYQYLKVYFWKKELKWMMTAPKFMTISLDTRKPTYKFPRIYGVFLYMKEFSLFLFSSYRPRLGLLGVGTNQRVSRVLKPLHRCDLGKAILKIFCVGGELSLSWSEKRDDIDAPNNDRDVSWRSTTPSRADCAPLLHQTPTTQVGKSGCSSFLLASEKTLLHHPSQIKRFTFFLPALFL